MPLAAPRFCSTPACRNHQPCPKHGRNALERRRHERRFQSGGNLYGRRWRKCRGQFLETHLFCVTCKALATEVDHRIPHRGDQETFWDESNWQAMCKPCHSAKTATEVGFRRV